MAFFGGSTSTTTATTDVKDVELVDPPGDSISCLDFSPTAEYLAVGSWNNEEGNKVFSGGADKAGRMFDVQTGQATQIAVHDAPIKCVKWIDAQGGILATGSWDKTLKYWDTRQSAPVAKVDLPDRCYTMDVTYPLLVVGTAERHIQMFNLNNPTTAYRTMVSPLKWQTRVISCFTTANGFAVGSIEGRVAIQYVDEKDSSLNFSFKCHRKDQGTTKDNTHVFAVNDMSFHPVHGTFSTAGADGTINFWDKDSKTRSSIFSFRPSARADLLYVFASSVCERHSNLTRLTSALGTAFNKTGSLFAYAVSYDWSKGYSGMTPDHPNKVMLHVTKDEEIKRRPKK
ncbi:unnamed protein product [Rhizoctonia solani]|uniref:Poly(A)+ RNA export protein n=1 Tax=Rhizoctonia solani TaxID=456999 RepID=A0A8H3HMB0_9AGAM|nr:unnamed protein product [Rhizoctonia solani]